MLDSALFDLSNKAARGDWKRVLTGTLPPEIANLSQLIYVYGDRNNFEGTLPLAWGQNHSLPLATQLNFSYNSYLSGERGQDHALPHMS